MRKINNSCLSINGFFAITQLNFLMQMKSPMRCTYLSLIFVIFLSVGIQPFQAVGLERQKNEKEKITDSTEEQKTTFIDIYSWATILPKELIDLQNRLTKEKVLRSVEEELPQLSVEINNLKEETSLAGSSLEMQLPQIVGMQAKTERLRGRVSKINQSVSSSISSLTGTREDWMNKKDQILGIKNRNELPFNLGKAQHQKLVETVDEALRLTEGYLKQALTLGKETGDLQIILYSIESGLETLDIEIKSASIHQTAPSMLSPEFYSRINFNLILESFARTEKFFVNLVNSLQDNLYYVLFGGLVFILLSLAIHKTKDITPPNSRWHSFAKRPVATAVFIGSCVNVFVNRLPMKTVLPEQLEALLHILTLLAVMRLTKHLVGNKEKRRLLNQLTFFLGMTMTLILMGLPQMLVLLYIFYVSVVAFVYYFFKLPSTKGRKFSEIWLKRGWGIFPVIVLISGLTGYDQFAVMVFFVLLSSVIACLIIWMTYLLILGLLELILSLLPFAIIKDSYSAIIKGVKPIVALLHLHILIIIQSVIWDIYPTIDKAFLEINNLGFDFVGVHISPKFIVTVAFVFYGALIASKATQVLLLKNVLPRYKAERGVQLSIARLVHYAILTVGFLVMLRVLGFQLNQLTLLGGALGVGIGFGLQAIVNNFASGLILLFERPIKVGDTIQLGTEWGEVKQLGLRATVIQTFDNAEIVIPNSDLITGQVTNWTLADRKVRVKIPIGVAYGTEVETVLEVLVSCAKANPMVLSTPKPNALFLAFGASSLDFELRVWIPEFLDKFQVLSDLNQDIDSEFALNNIEIPFPQSDLHLRSVDEKAANHFRGTAAHAGSLPKEECKPAQE